MRKNVYYCDRCGCQLEDSGTKIVPHYFDFITEDLTVPINKDMENRHYVLVFDALKAGFKENCYDGKPFFAQDHASGKDGKQTVSNMTTEKLSTDAYVEARAAMMGLLGDQGKSLNIVPNLLVVSPANEKMGRLILEADQIEGTTNVLKGTAELLVVTELADQPDYWFLLATQKALKPIIYQKRKPIKLTSKTNDNDDTVFMKDQFIWGADGRSNAGYGFWQMAYGSTGTTSSKG